MQLTEEMRKIILAKLEQRLSKIESKDEMEAEMVLGFTETGEPITGKER